MPRVRFASRSRRRSRRRSHSRVLATRPRMMPRSLAFKRFNQVSTRVFWFKQNGTIAAPPTGNSYTEFRWSLINTQAQFLLFREIFDQYKLLGFKVTLHPANVGTEPTANPTPATALPFNRGNHLIWSDQRFDPNAQNPVFIANVINTASARMINPRRTQRRAIWRPHGKPAWGSMKDIANTGDNWRATINLLINNSTLVVPPLQPPVLYFYTIQWKVVFRGRCQD